MSWNSSTSTYRNRAWISARAADGSETVLWEGGDPTTEAPKDLVVKPAKAAETRTIRIYLDSKSKSGWNEIDAVGVHPCVGERSAPAGKIYTGD